MPTPADIYLMKVLGYNILTHITRMITVTFLFGTFVIIFLATATTMIKRGLKSLPSIIIFSTIVINFILVSTSLACDTTLFVRYVRYTFLDQTATTFNSKTISEFSKISWRYAIVQTTLQQLMLTLSDSVVIWRAWVLVPKRWMMALPIVLVVGSTVCGFTYVAFFSSNFRWFIASINVNMSPVHLMRDASLALSFLANTCATLLIAHTLWLHLRSRKVLILHKKPPKVLKALAIIIDTGVAFLLLQGLAIALEFLPFNHYSVFDFFQSVISCAYVSLTGMYSTIVIYLVNQQRSLVEAFELSDPNANGTPEVPFDRTITIGPLELARPVSSADSISLTDVSDMGFTDTAKGTIIIPVDSSARDKTQDMV
ncbi:hypothetical protein H2248_011161 [Termitomyces sp. 'cryptogamus']|nr:hypothetical protein H2248_011161 [Termitomyces sp. 'cryptogamus']